MSGVKIGDFLHDHPRDFDMADPFKLLTEHLDDMEIPDNLKFENHELMSSEFFDTVLSLEEQTSNYENGFNSDNVSSSNVDSDFALNSDPEELGFNYSPGSVNKTFTYDISDCTTINNDNIHANINSLLKKKPKQSTNKSATPTIQVPGRIVVNNPNGKKVIVTKPCVKNSRRNVPNAKHLFKVQSISGNGRTLLLPFNVANMKNIKIINGKELSSENIQVSKAANVPMMKFEDSYSASSPDSVDDDSDSLETKCSRQYPLLVLTEEEKKLLTKDGIRLPTRYPLTKTEEKELKRIRRKIRNKISAQDSRKRKKEYVDGLEKKLKHNSDEKKILLTRIKVLQQENKKLLSHLQKLQALVFSTNKVTPTTCLLIVLMSALLISLPNLSITKAKGARDEQQVVARRTLLSSQRATNEDNGSLDEFLLFNANRKRPRIDTFEEDVDEVDALRCAECKHKKTFIQADDIEMDVQSTLHTMKDFFTKHFNFGNNNEDYNEVSRKIAKGDHLCSDDYKRSNMASSHACSGVALHLLDPE